MALNLKINARHTLRLGKTVLHPAHVARAELPLLNCHCPQCMWIPMATVTRPHLGSDGPALGLGAEELVEALAFPAHRCWRVVRLSWVSILRGRGSVLASQDRPTDAGIFGLLN
jgi:hypothetical protein